MILLAWLLALAGALVATPDLTGVAGAAHNYDRLTQLSYSLRPDGLTRHIALEYGDNAGGTTFDAEQSFAGTSGYEGLDRFGRPKDLHYTRGGGGGGGGGDTLWRARSGYDASGNRLFERIDRASNTSGGVESNVRSWLFAYDDLDRLVAADTGELNSGNAAIGASSALPVPRRWAWALDVLGNWSGDASAQPPSAGLTRRGDFDADGVEDVLEHTHAADARNRLGTLLEGDGSGGTPAATDLVHDRAGNLVCDGTHLYQYDGLNRLVAVRQKGSLTFDSNGEVDGGTAGEVVVVYAYDALGRLVRRQAPYPGYPGEWRSEHYYYDGARRIQEVFTDPIPNHSPVSTAEEEEEFNPVTWADREHVWGPGSVDEHLAQIDGWGILGYSLLDPSGTPVLVLDEQGRPSEAAVFDPYGNVIDHRAYAGALTLHGNRLGRQGLFYERLDADVLQPQLAAGSAGLYQVRNRAYLPGLGRWAQMDPNGAGQPTADGGACEGMSLILGSPRAFDWELQFGDGINVFAYLGANPVMRADPSGLFIGMGLGATTGTDLYSDYSEEAIDSGMSMADWLSNKVNEYAFDQLLDANWASEWGEPDDLYRGSAAWASGTGSWAFAAHGGETAGGHAMAGSVLDSIRGTMDKKARGMGVYLVLDAAGNVIYAGRSVNLDRRMKQSKAIRGGASVIGVAVNSRETMRALEDLLIRRYKQLGQAGGNAINGISRTNKNRKLYARALKQFLSTLR